MVVFAVLLLISALLMFVGMGILNVSSRFPMEEDVACLIRLLVSVVKCDGEADPEEIAAVKSYISSSPRWGTYIIKYFEQELDASNVKFLGYESSGVPLFVLNRKEKDWNVSKYSVSDLSSNAISKLFRKYSERMEFMDVLFQIAYSQEGVSDVEVDLLREMAHYLCIKSWDFTGFLYKYEYMMDEQQKKQKKQEEKRKRTEKDKSETGRNERQKAHETRFKNVTNTRTREALQLLEITENADEQEIKSAYRRLAKMYHPDTLPANVSEKEKEEAAARFRSIHEAYEFLLSAEMLRVK